MYANEGIMVVFVVLRFNLQTCHRSMKYGKMSDLGDNCIQNFHLGRYIVRYTVGNFVLQRCDSGVVIHNFLTYIR